MRLRRWTDDLRDFREQMTEATKGNKGKRGGVKETEQPHKTINEKNQRWGNQPFAS